MCMLFFIQHFLLHNVAIAFYYKCKKRPYGDKADKNAADKIRRIEILVTLTRCTWMVEMKILYKRHDPAAVTLANSALEVTTVKRAVQHTVWSQTDCDGM